MSSSGSRNSGTDTASELTATAPLSSQVPWRRPASAPAPMPSTAETTMDSTAITRLRPRASRTRPETGSL